MKPKKPGVSGTSKAPRGQRATGTGKARAPRATGASGGRSASSGSAAGSSSGSRSSRTTTGRSFSSRGAGRTGGVRGPGEEPARRVEKSLGGEQVEGRQAVRELLIAGNRRVKEIWVSADPEENEVIGDIVEIARFDDWTNADLEDDFLNLETDASDEWNWSLSGGSTLTLGQDKTQEVPDFSVDGLWILALRCNTCYNPAPLFLTLLEPQ